MRFERVQTHDEGLQGYLALFRACFPKATQYSLDYLRWMYRDNPEGVAFGHDAIDGNRVVAHFVGLPGRIMLAGEPQKSLLILNVATHPEHQRKGLFADLANRTRDAAKQAGFDLLFGVANALTIPGYRDKLGYQDVGGLDARLGVGRIPRIDWTAAQAKARFFRIWTPESLSWRLHNPENPVAACMHSDGTAAFEAATAYPGMRAYAEMAGDVGVTGDPSNPFAARIFIGLAPPSAQSTGWSLLIPEALRPSPLRLIFLDLRQPTNRIRKEDVLLSFLDFDAF